jgi:hypothetical protein
MCGAACHPVAFPYNNTLADANDYTDSDALTVPESVTVTGTVPAVSLSIMRDLLPARWR